MALALFGGSKAETCSSEHSAPPFPGVEASDWSSAQKRFMGEVPSSACKRAAQLASREMGERGLERATAWAQPPAQRPGNCLSVKRVNSLRHPVQVILLGRGHPWVSRHKNCGGLGAARRARDV